jgi:hypothetical protein
MRDAEHTLVAAMMLLAARKGGDLCRDNGYPPPTEEQTADMSRLWRAAFTAFVSGLPSPDREPTEAEMEWMEAVVEGATQGAILRVLGRPPGSKGNEN